MVQSARRPRTLGDKLYLLRHLSEEDVRDIEILVDYRIQLHIQEESDRIRAYAKPKKSPFAVVSRR